MQEGAFATITNLSQRFENQTSHSLIHDFLVSNSHSFDTFLVFQQREKRSGNFCSLSSGGTFCQHFLVSNSSCWSKCSWFCLLRLVVQSTDFLMSASLPFRYQSETASSGIQTHADHVHQHPTRQNPGDI